MSTRINAPIPQIFTSPRYFQGPNLLFRVGEFTSKFRAPGIVIAEIFKTAHAAQLAAAFPHPRAEYAIFNGECCYPEIDRIYALFRNVDCVVAWGGGKTIDTGRVVANRLKKPCIVVPTAASTDAPCSSCAVIYTPEGVYQDSINVDASPALVLVDTEIVARAPVRLTIAGIGDALSTRFEAEACEKSGALNVLGGVRTHSARALSSLCFDLLLRFGVQAVTDIRAGNFSTPAVEGIIEANTLLSGLGFESGGLAASHGLHNAMTVWPGTHSCYHGEKVAFATIVQLFLENRLELAHQVATFCKAVGLPYTLEQVGISPADQDQALAMIAENAVGHQELMKHMPFEVTMDMLIGAMKAANDFGLQI